MLATFFVTFREGLEAFLICAVTLAYLHKTGRDGLKPAVFAGAAFALVLSLIFAVAIEDWYEANEALAEGLFSIVAGILVFSLTFHMMRAGRAMKANIERHLEASAQRPGNWAYLATFGFITLLVLREGIEIVILMLALTMHTTDTSVLIGAMLGIGAAIAMGIAWNRYSRSINLGIFLQATAIFLALFSVHLVFYGLHELVEIGLVNLGPMLNEFFAEYSPTHNIYVQVFNILIVAVPLVWLAWTSFNRKRIEA